MSYLRFLLRYVYRELHELSDRSHWYGTSRQRYDSRRIFRAYPSGKACRHEDHGTGREKYPSQRHHDAGSFSECIDCGYGTWMLYKYHAASARYRKRSRCGTEPGDRQRDLCQDSESVPSGTCRSYLYGRPERSRRCLCGNE